MRLVEVKHTCTKRARQRHRHRGRGKKRARKRNINLAAIWKRVGARAEGKRKRLQCCKLGDRREGIKESKAHLRKYESMMILYWPQARNVDFIS